VSVTLTWTVLVPAFRNRHTSWLLVCGELQRCAPQRNWNDLIPTSSVEAAAESRIR